MLSYFGEHPPAGRGRRRIGGRRWGTPRGPPTSSHAGVKFGWLEGCLLDIVKPSGRSANSARRRGESVSGRPRLPGSEAEMGATTSFQEQGSGTRSEPASARAFGEGEVMERADIRAAGETADVPAARGLYDPTLD